MRASRLDRDAAALGATRLGVQDKHAQARAAGSAPRAHPTPPTSILTTPPTRIYFPRMCGRSTKHLKAQTT